ncbi:5-hydroxytryptamine receptor 4-like [Haliotis rubra]|uniref:5-hydroxytryptamine receptor 4-like n=1 Tax=Haliotis rubra TaxID=36100 RepID=UPI001EE5BC1E|nr:5-hydroxytryptamine receptor 4-like [Haliotis rubra]
MTIAPYKGMSCTAMFMLTLFTLLGCLVCIGNLLTVVAVFRTEELRTTPNMYIVSLACSDFLLGLTVPFFVSSNVPNMEDLLDRSLFHCAFRYGVLYLILSESFLCICAISVDRYVYIKHPLHYHIYLSPKKTGLVIASTWCVSLMVGACTLLTSTWPGYCSFFHVVSKSFQLYFIMPYTAAIFVLNAVMYSLITKEAIQHRQRIQVRNSPINTTIRCKATLRSIRHFIMVYGTFVVCWLPAAVVNILGHTYGVGTTTTGITLSLGLLNSGVNFIIYAFMNKAFKKAFLKLFLALHVFCCRMCR